jgi:hypothetical protein
LRVQLNSAHNPYADRKPQVLTASQENQRRRGRIRMKRKYA